MFSESAYLMLVIAAFLAFALTLATVSRLNRR